MERIVVEMGSHHENDKEKFEQFRNKANDSHVPEIFYQAAKKILSRPRPAYLKEDDVIIETANLLFDFKFKNVHEASFLLHYASAVSLIKTANIKDDEEEKDRIITQAKQEFGKASFCASFSQEVSKGIRNRYSLLFKLAGLTGKVSNLKRIQILTASAEEYFSDPQIRARMTLLAH